MHPKLDYSHAYKFNDFQMFPLQWFSLLEKTAESIASLYDTIHKNIENI